MKVFYLFTLLVAGTMAGKLSLPRLPLKLLMQGGWPMIDDDKIVGGTQASPNEFPYQISLRRLGSHICGGSVYDADYIITAAHCTDGTAVGSLSIVAGEHSLSTNSGLEQVRSVAAKIEHPLYNSNSQENDICLLRLSSPLTLNSVVAPVTLPAQGAATATGTDCVVSGWGTTSSGGSTIPDILRKVTVPIVSDASCRASYGINAISDSMICAGFSNGGADSCQGDSGGPLVVQGTRKLVGVVSWGIGCGSPNYYGVYTEVAYFHNWIVNNAN